MMDITYWTYVMLDAYLQLPETFRCHMRQADIAYLIRACHLHLVHNGKVPVFYNNLKK